MLPKAKWLPNFLSSSAKDDKAAHPVEQEEKDKQETVTNDDSGSNASTFIIKNDQPAEIKDKNLTKSAVTFQTAKEDWDVQCICCEQQLRPGINCIPTNPKSYTCSSCHGYVCKNCKGQCHECTIKNNLILKPEVLMTIDNVHLLSYLQFLHYPPHAFDNWKKEYLVKQLLTRFNVYPGWVPKPVSETSSKKSRMSKPPPPPPPIETKVDETAQHTGAVAKRGTTPQHIRPLQANSIFYMRPVSASTPLLDEKASTVHRRTHLQDEIDDISLKKTERNIKSKSLEMNSEVKQLDQSATYKDFKLAVSTSELQAVPLKDNIKTKDYKRESKHAMTSTEQMQARPLTVIDKAKPDTYHKSSKSKPRKDNQQDSKNHISKGESINTTGSASTVTAESWKYASTDPIVPPQNVDKINGAAISIIRKSATPQSERTKKKESHGSRDEDVNVVDKFDSLKDISCLKDIEELRSKEMKTILKKHGVDVRTLSNDQALRYAVIRLWSYKKEGIGSAITNSGPEVSHKGQNSQTVVGPQILSQQPVTNTQQSSHVNQEARRKSLSAPKTSPKGRNLKDISSIRTIENMDVSELCHILHYHKFKVKHFDKKHQMVYAVICLWNAYHAIDDPNKQTEPTTDTLNDPRQLRWAQEAVSAKTKEFRPQVTNNQPEVKITTMSEVPKPSKVNATPGLPILESVIKANGHSHATTNYTKAQYLESWLQNHNGDTSIRYGEQPVENGSKEIGPRVVMVHTTLQLQKEKADTNFEIQAENPLSPSIISFTKSILPRTIQEEFIYIDDSFSDISAPLAPRTSRNVAPLASKTHL